MARILIIEDDPSIRAALRDALELTGHAVTEAADGRAGLERALSGDAELVLLDIMLPEIDGLHVLEGIRARKPALPVICLTALGEEADRVRGLRAGADDYVVKPFGIDELLARVEAVLRRAAAPAPPSDGALDLAGRRVRLDRQEVTIPSGETRQLPLREAELLGYLAAHRGRAITREELLEKVWGIDPRGMQTRTVDMAIVRLRDALADTGPDHTVIITIRGRGYMLAGEAP